MNFIGDVALLFFITFIPFVELRLAIPIGILSGTLHLPFGYSITGLGMNPLVVFLIVITANFMTGIIVYFFLMKFDHWARKKAPFKEWYCRWRTRTEKKVKKFTKKFGFVGLALFIAIPFPGSGVYAGTLGAFILEFPRKKFLLATAVGVTLAGVVVTLFTLSGQMLFI
jgi:uncharacterized membrane protein